MSWPLVTRQLLDAYCALFPTLFHIFLPKWAGLISVRNSRCFYPQRSGFTSICKRRRRISPSSHVPAHQQTSGSSLRYIQYEWAHKIKCRGIILSLQAQTTRHLHSVLGIKIFYITCAIVGALHSTKSMCLVVTGRLSHRKYRQGRTEHATGSAKMERI